MRVRLSVSRQIQLVQLTGYSTAFVACAAIVGLRAYPPSPALFVIEVVVVGAVSGWLASRLALRRWPSIPQTFRRPWKAVLPALLVAALLAIVMPPEIRPASPLGGLTLDDQVANGFRAASGMFVLLFAYLLWPPDPIAPPASLRKLLRLDENPPLFGLEEIEPVDTPRFRWSGGDGPRP